MKNLIEYQIPLTGLKEGVHHYTFEVRDEFFEHFEYSEVKHGKIKANITLEKESTLLVLDFDLEGEVELECGKCLELFNYRLKHRNRVVVKFGDEISDERHIGEEVQIIPYDLHQINVSEFIYEFIHLALPVKREHPLDKNGKSTCNPEMLDIIDEYSFRKEEPDETDPRWDKLKDFLKN